MKNLSDGVGYNERLFAGGLRSYLHYARFRWFTAQLRNRSCRYDSVLEIGCFDGKLISFLPSHPSTYVGFDADWEGGISLAKIKWAGHTRFSFRKACSPADIELNKTDRFDIAVAMETLEHIPPELVDGYLRKIAEHLDGYLFITVPNEKGIFFLAKWIIKKLFSKDAQDYTFNEILNTTLGRMSAVRRVEHKGFDYSQLIKEIQQYFDIVEVSGHPFEFLPHTLCFGIGIIAKSKTC